MRPSVLCVAELFHPIISLIVLLHLYTNTCAHHSQYQASHIYAILLKKKKKNASPNQMRRKKTKHICNQQYYDSYSSKGRKTLGGAKNIKTQG